MDLKRPPLRHVTLDALRGIAVMGILLMNIAAFAMPEAGYFNPLAWGGSDQANLWVWTANFILIDGKMRCLFSMLFGASMVLVMGRADKAGSNGLSVHLRRMVTLLMFGLAHYYFVWNGDILTLYAACGIMVGLAFHASNRHVIRRWMFILFGLSFLLWGLMGASLVFVGAHGSGPSASQSARVSAAGLRETLGQPGSARITAEIERYRGSYEQIALHRVTVDGFDPVVSVLSFGCETAALMLLGILLFRTGALTGKWPQRLYLRAGLICYAIGLPGGALLAWLVWQSGFDPIMAMATSVSFSLPFHVLTMLGHAAFAIIAIKRFAATPAVARIAAAGRAAFSNYLATSLIMTSLFYGYGLGWYGWVERWQAMVIAVLAWGLMLLWSKPWLDRFHYGPLEWLWRSAARGQWQKLRRTN